MVFDTVVQEISKQYNFPPSVAAFRLFNYIRDYNKIGSLKKELNKLTTQVFSVNEICFCQNKYDCYAKSAKSGNYRRQDSTSE